MWMQKRLAPEGSARTPKPSSILSRRSQAEGRGSSALTRPPERVIFGMVDCPARSCRRGTGIPVILFRMAISGEINVGKSRA